MSAAKMILAALLLPALILAAVTAVAIWIVHQRRNRQIAVGCPRTRG